MCTRVSRYTCYLQACKQQTCWTPYRRWSWRARSSRSCTDSALKPESGSGLEPAPSLSRTHFPRRSSISSAPTSMSSESRARLPAHRYLLFCNVPPQSWNIVFLNARLSTVLHQLHDRFNCPPHWSLSPYLPPLLCTDRWLWGIRNSTQDPLTPISSPGGSLPPSVGQSSPNCPAAVLSPGQVAARWDRPSLSILPAAWETTTSTCNPSIFISISLWVVLSSMVSVSAPLWR